jgi:hypothetical protein
MQAPVKEEVSINHINLTASRHHNVHSGSKSRTTSVVEFVVIAGVGCGSSAMGALAVLGQELDADPC